MAFVDLARNALVLKVVVAGPPAVGKTSRLEQIGGFAQYGSGMTGHTSMATLDLVSEGTSRPVKIELYEWHGPEKADVRSKALFAGLDGLVYIADAREDRFIDTQRQLEFLIKVAGRSRIARLPALLMLGQMDEGLLRVASIEKELDPVVTWSDRFDAAIDDEQRWVEAARVLGEVMLARLV